MKVNAVAATFLIIVHLQSPRGAAQQLSEHDTEVCHRNSSAVVKLMADFLGLEECKSKKGKPDASWSKINLLEADLAEVKTGLVKLQATSQGKSAELAEVKTGLTKLEAVVMSEKIAAKIVQVSGIREEVASLRGEGVDDVVPIWGVVYPSFGGAKLGARPSVK